MTRGPNSRYSKEFRSEAVKMVVEGGLSAYEVSRQLSLPKSTLENWVRAFKAGKLSDIVDKYGRDNNYSLILDTSAQTSPVVFNATQLDITSDIVRLYDQAHPLQAGSAAPATPGQSAKPGTPAPAAPAR